MLNPTTPGANPGAVPTTRPIKLVVESRGIEPRTAECKVQPGYQTRSPLCETDRLLNHRTPDVPALGVLFFNDCLMR